MSELKERALLERIGELTVSYEDKVASYRVMLTELTAENKQLRERLESTITDGPISGELLSPEDAATFLAAHQPLSQNGEVIEGTVVQ